MSERKTEEYYKKVDKLSKIGMCVGGVGLIYSTSELYATGKEILNNEIEIVNADLEKLSSPTNNVNFYADKMSVGMTTPSDILDSTDSII